MQDFVAMCAWCSRALRYGGCRIRWVYDEDVLASCFSDTGFVVNFAMNYNANKAAIRSMPS